MSVIGDRIRARRIELNMSQDELAKKMGYSTRTTIYKIEVGKNDVSQSKIEVFAKALDTTPAYLMGWEKEKPAAPEGDELTAKKRALIEKIKSLDDSDIDVVSATADAIIARRAK